MLRTLKLNAIISDSKNRRPQNYVGRRPKMGGPGSMESKMQLLAMNLLFRARRDVPMCGIETVRHVDSTGINRLAVRLQKLYFMKPLFLKM